MEQQSRLFTAFEQADGSISRKFGGTGLGLSISRSIAEKMGGRIWVESEPDRGSVFSFEVPLVQAPDHHSIVFDIDKATVPDDKENEVTDFSDLRILLAEDIDINRDIFIALLEDTKIKIDTVENGIDAVQRFKKNPGLYDLIIMDVQMPEMDGYQATREIRAMDLPEAKTIPIIAMTANAFKEDVERCLESGMNDHLPKPIDEKLVIEKIKQYTK
jgi:CheY-like chemotaxis protein